MNLIEVANQAKELSDSQLQRQLLNPDGSIPSFLALSELNRRKQMRNDYASRAQSPPKQSMAEELAQGIGGQAQSPYAQAVNGAEQPGQPGDMGGPPMTPPPDQMGGDQPPQGMSQPQGFADGGVISENTGNPWDDMFLGAARGVDRYARSQAEYLKRIYGGAQDLMTAEPGYSLGETLARRGRGQSAFIPPTARTPGDEGIMVEPPVRPGSQGFGGPEPMGLEAAAPPAGAPPVAPNAGPPAGPAGGPPVAGGGAGPAGLGAAAGPAGGGGGGGAGGGSPIANRANQSLGDFYNEIQSIKLPDRYGELAKLNQQDREKLTSQADSDKGIALLTAGLGIMGGTSPYAAVNIGQGAMAGVKYWSDAQKEMRQAQRDVRNADQAIAIAQANRDERGLENAIKVKSHAEEMHQRSLDRANAAGIAASARAQALELKKMELDSLEKNRVEQQEQHRIDSFRTAATAASREADTLDAKASVIGIDPSEATRLQAQAQKLRAQAQESQDMYRRTAITREVRLGNLVVASPTERGMTIDGKKMKKGQRFVTHDYRTGTWDED